MKRKNKLTEGDLRRIVKESVNKTLNEDFSKDNQVIEEIWNKLSPMFNTVCELNMIYGDYLNKAKNNFGFIGRFGDSFNNVYNGMRNMEMIYNH